MSLAEKLKGKSRIHWTTLRGEKIGLCILSHNEMRQYIAALDGVDTEDHRGIFEVFAPMVIDTDKKQALTVDEMEEILSDSELSALLKEFNSANGLSADESEKN